MNTPTPQVLGLIFDPTSPFLISGNFFLLIIKGMFLIGFGLYVIFAFAVLRQSALMTRSLKTGYNLLLSLFCWLHLAAAVAIWIFALVSL